MCALGDDLHGISSPRPFCDPMVAPGDDAAEHTDSVPPLPPQPRRRRQQRRRGQGPTLTILIVDDEEPVRQALLEVLRLQGYRVLTAASVEQAEATKTQLGAEGIQLLIVDVNLLPATQVRAGYALAQRWRATHPALPIILISGDPSNEALPEVRDGSLRFLLKPFRMDALIAMARRALGG
jgi:two-component system, cell cycle sensor histidine kinase and response regulator CckA